MFNQSQLSFSTLYIVEESIFYNTRKKIDIKIQRNILFNLFNGKHRF